MAARLLAVRPIGSLLFVLLAVVLTAAVPGPLRGQDPIKHDVTVTGEGGRFDPVRIEAGSGDILRVTLVAEGSPCSFAIDAYRISKRATPGHPVTFEFRADRAGRFPFYCDLTTDDRCRTMRGELIVDGR